MSTTTKKPWTAGELCRLPAGWRYEIDEGELVIMSPAGWRHSTLIFEVGRVLDAFVRARRLGKVGGGEAGFRLRREPETLRAADIAYVSNERLAAMRDPSGFPDVPPDLAVEIHDPSEPDLGRKVGQYLAAGVRSVWVVDPEARTLTQHRPGEAPRTFADPSATVDEPVLPGFACALGELFGEEARA